MPSPKEVSLVDWNVMLESFRGETDRGAAILVGSFVEHALGHYLRSKATDQKVVDALFAPLGPLSSFSQRIAVAYAFGFVPKELYDDLELIRKIRNHFAHHPMDTTFRTKEVLDAASRPSMAKEGAEICDEPGYAARIAYLLTCGMVCGRMLMKPPNSGRRLPAPDG